MIVPVRRGIATFVGLGLLIAVPSVSVAATAEPRPAAPQARAQADRLGGHDEALLAKARASGKKDVELLVVTDPGQGDDVAASVRNAGGTVEFRKDAVNYQRVEVPVDKVDAVAALGAVRAVDVDEAVPAQQTGAQPKGLLDPRPQPAPGTSTPRNNPYLPTQDVGTSQFTAAHPTWDGRGIRIAVIDSGIDLDNPALQTTSTGERKIVDWVTATDPTFVNGINADNDPTWIRMTSSVEADPTFSVGGGTWTAPAPGSYRFGTFNERDQRLGGELGNDVNRDGNPAGSNGLFGVLWDRETGTVWVDHDQDHSFANEAAMTDYRLNHDVGSFGSDDPATPVRETVPFVVQTDKQDQAVNIGLVSGAQGTHVAGVAAANGVFGGQADGAAPGAQLVSVRACLFVGGCTDHALLEGMIYAADEGDADIINLSIGEAQALNDGNNARAELYNSIIDTYGVQIVISAGDDGAGVDTVNDPAVATQAVAVGSYVSRATRLSNYGVLVNNTDNLDPGSSAGPREDGGLKPELVAPGSAVSTTPTWEAGRPVPGTFSLPPGLGMLDGTSVAAAQVSGAAADLASAAKAQGVAWSPALLRLALRSSSRFIFRYDAYRQGSGLLNTNAAWQVLRKAPHPTEISATVETHTNLSGFLHTPGVGTGIYDREGVAVGDEYTRTYTLTRTSGPSTPTTAVLSWLGDDGTFGPPLKSVKLPKDQPVEVPVTVHVRTGGVHSALLSVDDTSSPGIELRTLNTVVAPYELGKDSPTQQVNATIERAQTRSYFFRVAPGTGSFSVDLAETSRAGGSGQMRFLRFDPNGSPIDDSAEDNCYEPAVAGCTSGSPTRRTVTDPTPGVWEVVVEARRSSTPVTAPFSLTVATLGVTVAPDPDVIRSLPAGTPTPRSYTVTNPNGAFVGHAVGGTLGSARRETPTINEGNQSQFPVAVTAGSTQLRATISNASDSAADLDMFLYNCTDGSCVLAKQSTGKTSNESLVVNNPSPGLWLVLVDGFDVPQGSTTYDYEDVVTNPGYGSIVVDDSDAQRPTGASWQVTGTITANTAPPAGRVLLGSVQVMTTTGEVVGSNEVIVQAVE